MMNLTKSLPIFENDKKLKMKACLHFQFFGHFANLVNSLKRFVYRNIKCLTFGTSINELKRPIASYSYPSSINIQAAAK